MSPYHHGSLAAALLKAAEDILERDGVGALTLRAAAREAGVSHAAPAHHFGDLSGLLTALAASGFTRLHDAAETLAADAGPGADARMTARSRGYIEFARVHPGLFQLMFRSERLDWTNPALSIAGASTFALLRPSEADAPLDFQALVEAAARWSFLHGLAMLLIDGRLASLAKYAPGAEVDDLIAALLGRLSLNG